MSSTIEEQKAWIDRLVRLRDAHKREARRILERATSGGQTELEARQDKRFKQLVSDIRGVTERIEDERDELRRLGGDHPLLNRREGGLGADAYARNWARETREALRRNLGGPESRAVISGSVDIPLLVEPQVVGTPFKGRLIDAFAVRQAVDSMAFEYFQQTARTNNAAATPDLATKPTSVLTVQAITDRCRVVATLSEPLPLRIWLDDDAIASWLYTQLAGCVLDAIEQEAIGSATGTGPGAGSGEHMVGILKVSGTTAVPFATDVPTTLRKAITAMQNLGEVPTGWVLNPADAEAIDLLRWGASGGLLTEGYLAGNAPGDGTSNNIFGTYPRIVSPNVPAGTAILADWLQLKLYYREQMRIDVDGSGVLFDTNAVKFRAESRVGIGILRPQAFAVVDLTA